MLFKLPNNSSKDNAFASSEELIDKNLTKTGKVYAFFNL